MDFGISYVPSGDQTTLPPKEPIVKKEYATKEEVQSLISESEAKTNTLIEGAKLELTNKANELIRTSEAKQSSEVDSKIELAKSEMESKCNELITEAIASLAPSKEEPPTEEEQGGAEVQSVKAKSKK